MNDVEIDDKVVERLKNWIVIEEGKNLKTRAFTDSEMIKNIKKRIEEEVECYLNQLN